MQKRICRLIYCNILVKRISGEQQKAKWIRSKSDMLLMYHYTVKWIFKTNQPIKVIISTPRGKTLMTLFLSAFLHFYRSILTHETFLWIINLILWNLSFSTLKYSYEFINTTYSFYAFSEVCQMIKKILVNLQVFRK